MKDLLNSIKDYAKERLGNVMYGTFFMAWIGWNWKAVYITFFIDEQKIFTLYQQLKIDYIINLYPNTWNVLQNMLIGPTISVIIFIWVLSKLDFVCSKKHYSNKIEKEIEKDRQQKKLLEKKQEVLKEKQEVVKREKEIKTEMSDEQKWLAEIKNIKNNKLFVDAMRELEKCLYQYKGRISNYDYELQPKYISFLDTNSIINFTSGNRNTIELTNKGKFFLNTFINDRERINNEYI